MPSVKISQLPTRAAVFGNDRIPVVDAAETQTSTATAAQIAAIGGGPPGDGTVTSAKLANGAVLFTKFQNVSGNKLLGNATNIAGVVEEITCNAVGRNALAATTQAGFCAAIGALQSTENPVFTGTVQFPPGTATAPGLTSSDDPNTGIYFPEPNTIGIVTDGTDRFLIGPDGSMSANMPATSLEGVLRPAFFVRAWGRFALTGSNRIVLSNAADIGYRYRGVSSSLRNDQNTRDRIKAVEEGTASGLTATNRTLDITNDLYAKQGPLDNSGVPTGKTNYTNTTGKFHWRWDPTANAGAGGWVKITASGNQWIGTIKIGLPAPGAGSNGLVESGFIKTFTRTAAGEYTVYFTEDMPDTNYCVCVSASDASRIMSVTSFSVGSFNISCRNDAGTATDSAGSFIVLR